MLAVNKRALEGSRSFSVAMLVAMFVYVITHLRKDDHAPTSTEANCVGYTQLL